MAVDPEIAAVLEQIKFMEPMDQMQLATLRASMPPLAIGLRAQVGTVEDLVIHGTLPIRIYQSIARSCPSLLVFFHGGGFVLGSLETHDHVCRELCATIGCTVIAVDYRLAPEFPFPAATDDCLLAARWAFEHAAALGASPRHVVLGGDSAGATLAAVTALRLRDEGGPLPCGQYLGYPITNYHTPATASYLANATGYSLTRAAMIRFWRDYLASEDQALHPHASPLQAIDLSRLPPALIMTAEYDPLRDEGEAYAAKLAEFGVAITLVRKDGLIHGFLRMAAVSRRARQAFVEIGTWVRALPAATPLHIAPLCRQMNADARPVF